jgi:hypothetical protein
MVVATRDGSAMITPLVTPIPVPAGGAPQLPGELVFVDPGGNGNGKINLYKGGDMPKGAGFAVMPSTFNKVCPSETQGQIAQLAAALGGAIRDIEGEKQAPGDIVQDSKPGLIERAELLAKALREVK